MEYELRKDNFLDRNLATRLSECFEEYSKHLAKRITNYVLQAENFNSNKHVTDLIKHNSQEVFDIYYNLTFGFYDLTKVDKHIRNFSNYINNEVFEEKGKLFEPIDKIFKLLSKLEDMECKYRTTEKNFDPNETWSVEIREIGQHLLSDMFKYFFNHGRDYRKLEERHISRFL